MKLITGILPCKDRFFLDKALTVIKQPIEELCNLTHGEDDFYKVFQDIYSGIKQLMMVYDDIDNITLKIDEQVAVVGNVLKTAGKNFAGYVLIELWPNSLHVYQAYISPEYRGMETLRTVYNSVERQAKLLNAPYISLCTKEVEAAKNFGFIDTYTTLRKKL